MKFLVIGYGSIGKRHARNIRALGHEPVLLRRDKSRPNREGLREYCSLTKLFKSEGKLDAAVISSPTTRHLRDVQAVLKHNIPFLLEKPPAMDLKETLCLQKALKSRKFLRYDIAFNLRYYPVLQFIKKYLPKLGKIYSARVYAGHFLPDWRPGVDYRKTVSARRELGGGVHVELVHELDYVLWLFGWPQKVLGYVNKVSNLEISSADLCSSILIYRDGSVVELHLDYLSHKRLRGCQIVAQKATLEWDMSEGKVWLVKKGAKKSREIFKLPDNYDFNDTYIRELKSFIRIIDPPAPSNPGREPGVQKRRISPRMFALRSKAAGIGFGGSRRRIKRHLVCKHEELHKHNPATVNIDTALKTMRLLEAIKDSSRRERAIALNGIR